MLGTYSQRMKGQTISLLQRVANLSIEEVLEEIQVGDYGMYDENVTKEWTFDGWFCVENEDGVIAMFSEEEHALHFRLALVNAKLNPLTNS